MAHAGELRAAAHLRHAGGRGAEHQHRAAARSRPVLGAALLVTRALVITNPVAARLDVDAVQAVRDTLRGGGWRVDVLATHRPGDARRFAKEALADGYDALVAYGGDGTVMQAAASLVGTELPLGLVPGGDRK